jgi:hypothetical protein
VAARSFPVLCCVPGSEIPIQSSSLEDSPEDIKSLYLSWILEGVLGSDDCLSNKTERSRWMDWFVRRLDEN